MVGTAINILALGLTGVFFRALPHLNGATAAAFAPLTLPVLHPAHGLPSLPAQFASALLEQNALGWLAWALVPLCWLYLFRTRSGLRLRAVGEYPEAADGAGVRVGRVRVGATLAGGALAGLAGAYLSIGYTNGFVENMSAGRGFIALAVVILGRWNPFGVAAGRPAVRPGIRPAIPIPGVQCPLSLPILPRPALSADPGGPASALALQSRPARRAGRGLSAGSPPDGVKGLAIRRTDQAGL